VRRPPLAPHTIIPPDVAWQETSAALRLDADDLAAFLLPLRDRSRTVERDAVGRPASALHDAKVMPISFARDHGPRQARGERDLRWSVKG